MNKPLISVILPVYNMGELVAGAIDSILAQTETNFELIVLNDGSTDNTADILAAYAQRDERVVIVNNDHNLGLIRTLNIGLDRARGDYIARQDADNRSFPDRLSIQAAYLDEHADVGLVGMPVAVVTDHQQTDSRRIIPDIILPPALIPWELLAYPYFAHDTVMARRAVLMSVGGYDLEQVYAEDYDLWARVSHTTQLAMLPMPGAHFLLNPNGITQTFSEAQENTTAAIRSRAQSDLLNRVVAPAEASLLSKLIRAEIATSKELCSAKALLDELYLAYLNKYSLTDSEAALLESRVMSIYWNAKQTFNLKQC